MSEEHSAENGLLRPEGCICPICGECWYRMNPGIRPHRLVEPETEFCCLCNITTQSGIYIRRNPDEVPYPRRESDETA